MKKKKGSNSHTTVGKGGEMENITVEKWGWGMFHQRSHDRWKGRGDGLEGKGEGWERRGGGREERWA